MAKNRYTGVSRHPKTGQWKAQPTIKGKQTYLGLFPKQEDAAKCVAKALTRTVESLRKKSKAVPKVVPKQTHQHVDYHLPTHKWRVIIKSKQVCQTTSKHQAVEFAAKHLGVKPAHLLLKQASGNQGQRGLRTKRMGIFRLLWGAYRRGPKRGGRAWASLPGDAAYQYARLRPKHTAYKDAGLALPLLLAKYGPDKMQIEKAAKLRGPKADLEAHDYNRLAKALRGISENFNSEESKLWAKGPGVGTSFHGGLILWCWKSLQMIEPRPPKSRAPSIPLLQKRTRFVMKPLTKPLRARLSKSRAFGATLLAQDKAHVTLKAWLKVADGLCASCKGVPGLSPKSYRGKWVVRSWMDRCLRKRSWKGLTLYRGAKVASLIQAFPDNGGHLRILTGGRPEAVTLTQFCKELGYDGPVEHLTMWLCLLLSGVILRRLRGQDLAALKRLNWEGIRRDLTRKSCRVEVPPHPVHLVKVALKSTRQDGPKF